MPTQLPEAGKALLGPFRRCNVCAVRAGWHQLKHGSRAARGTRDEKRTLGDVIRVHCQVSAARLRRLPLKALRRRAPAG